jgi:hypothetical protein
MSVLGRLFASIVALAAVAALTAQATLTASVIGVPTPWALAWWMAGSFALLANAAVAAVLGLVGVTGLEVSARRAGAVTVSILAVAFVNHAFPSGSVPSIGLAVWADQGLHTVVPLLVLVWWLGYARRDSLRASDALAWLGWPLAYVAYALAREMLTGQATYAFLDVSLYGWPGVGVHVAGLCLLVLVIGAVLLLVAKALGPRASRRRRINR